MKAEHLPLPVPAAAPSSSPSPARAFAGTPLIELSGITRSFVNGELETRVLHGIDLAIHAGEFVAIVGASGSGKSTLMNVIGCLDRPSGGRYRFIYEHPVEPPSPDSADPVLEFTQRCTDVLEMYVRRHPELWLWMHRRWRERDPALADPVEREASLEG